jgi:hypothetical protein
MSQDRKYNGLYQGIVEDNEDPIKMGRLKIRVPAVFGDSSKISTKDLPWSIGMFPSGGTDDRGFINIPEKNAYVFVQFIEGDPTTPVWMGTSFSYFKENGFPVMPGEAESNYTKRHVWKHKGGVVIIDDNEGSVTVKKGGTFISVSDDSITLMHKSGAYIRIGAGNITVYPKLDSPTIIGGTIKGNTIMGNTVGAPHAPCLAGGSGQSPSCKPPTIPQNVSEQGPNVGYDNGSRKSYSGTSIK